MTRFLDWLDESAAGLIRVAYLLAGVIAVASYFSDGNVPRQFSDFLNTILPWALAAALEVHTYLTARRVRQAWQDRSAASLGSDEHERAGAQMKLNLWILGGLLAFSMYNQLQYLSATWTPPHTPLTPPGPWAYLIRATITPAAFMCAAFLAPIGEGLALQVQSQAHRLAVMTFKVAVQQWKRRLRQMQQAGQDVTGALVQLVDDPAERRVIEAIWQAMQHPAAIPAETAASEAPASVATMAATPLEALSSSTDTPAVRIAAHSDMSAPSDGPGDRRPPTGPGSPAAAPVEAPHQGDKRPAVLRLPAPPAAPVRRVAQGSAAARSNPTRKRKRAPLHTTDSREAQARAAWAKGARTVTAMVGATAMGRSTASKWVRTLAAETTPASDAGQLAQ